MIEAKGIYKSFGNVEVIKGIDIQIAKGEIVTIVGASGAVVPLLKAWMACDMLYL